MSLAAPAKLRRVFFPLLLTKKNQPRKRQKPVMVTINGKTFVIQRGGVVVVKDAVVETCEHFMDRLPEYEVFVSKREVKT